MIWSAKRLAREQRGAVLVEAFLALPLLTLITFGLLEFGNLMWQRQQLQVGVRDAARYWARCRPTFHSCSQTEARNIAFWGAPDGNPSGTRSLRVPGWNSASQLVIDPATPPTLPAPDDIVTVTGSVTYQGSPLYNAVFGDSIEIGYYHTTRYFGW